MKNILVIAFCILLMVFSACDSDSDGVNNTKDKCPDTPIGTLVDSVGCKVTVEKKLDKVVIYLDSSGSMRGYSVTKCNFQTNMLLNLAGRMSVLKNNGLIKNTVPELNIFMQKVSASSGDGGNSIIDQDLRKIADNLVDNSVALYITDGVLSYQNAGKGKTQLVAMQARVTDVSSELFAKGYACYVLASKSDFNGSHYWNYLNQKDRVNTMLSNRPYYLFIIGKDKDVQLFVDEVVKAGYDFEKALLINANPSNTLVSVESLYAPNLKIGDWTYNPAAKLIKINTPSPVIFPILLNLYKFAPTDSASLANAITVQNASKTTIYTKESFIAAFYPKGAIVPPIYKDATHVVLAEFNTPPQGTCAIEFNNSTWYKDWNIDDDRYPTNIDGKTFGVQYLMEGIVKAATNKTNLASLTIK